MKNRIILEFELFKLQKWQSKNGYLLYRNKDECARDYRAFVHKDKYFIYYHN